MKNLLALPRVNTHTQTHHPRKADGQCSAVFVTVAGRLIAKLGSPSADMPTDEQLREVENVVLANDGENPQRTTFQVDFTGELEQRTVSRPLLVKVGAV